MPFVVLNWIYVTLDLYPQKEREREKEKDKLQREKRLGSCFSALNWDKIRGCFTIIWFCFGFEGFHSVYKLFGTFGNTHF